MNESVPKISPNFFYNDYTKSYEELNESTSAQIYSTIVQLQQNLDQQANEK